MNDAALAARAECLKAALVQRREGEAVEQTLARADEFWAWVSQGPADNRQKPAR